MGGCGRFFEGTPEQMHKALIGTLSTLPGNTVSKQPTPGTLVVLGQDSLFHIA